MKSTKKIMSSVSPARRLALEVTSEIRRRDSYARQLVSHLIDTANLPREERAFAALLVYGVTACVGTLDEVIDESLRSPSDVKEDVRDALRISCYELIFLKKTDYAAVDQGVELVRSIAPRAAGLANAVLRKIATRAQLFPWGDPQKDTAALARAAAHPLWLVERIISDYGFERTQTILDSAQQVAPIFIAQNHYCSNDDFDNLLSMVDAHAKLYGVSGCYQLGSRSAIAQAEKTLLSCGRALVADAAAQQVAQIACPPANAKFLEIGAGRGTKTILMQNFTQQRYANTAHIHTVDNHAFKSKILIDRLENYHIPNVTVHTLDARSLANQAILDTAQSTKGFPSDSEPTNQAILDTAQSSEGFPSSFDGALIDAPCTGTGTFRRHPDQRWRLKPNDSLALAELGLAMLENAASLIKPGGYIVYATCSILKEENEAVVNSFLASQLGAFYQIQSVKADLVPDFAHALTPDGFFQTFPSPDGPDGHFAAKLVHQ